jgi:hypothetical protein
MQGFANLLGVAIERKQADARRMLLVRELNHRVKEPVRRCGQPDQRIGAKS